MMIPAYPLADLARHGIIGGAVLPCPQMLVAASVSLASFFLLSASKRLACGYGR
jgi:hypothetical protein